MGKRQHNMQRYTRVISSDSDERIDVFLAREISHLSRSWLQNLIREGDVQVNDKTVSPSYQLKKGDTIKARLSYPPEISLEPDSSLSSRIRVVFENDDFVIIDKPSGVVVHPSESTTSGTLVNWLLWKYPEMREVGEDRVRPGIVHRLDKGTSGLMVIAKTNDMFAWLKQQFQARVIGKRYLALVYGAVKQDEGEIRYPISRSKRNPRLQIAYKSASRVPSDARNAHTRWRVVRRFSEHTLLELTPITGRMHQIRVHLKAIGHPVVGDELYITKKYSKKGAGSGTKHIGRMFLHATLLRFTAPNGEQFSFSSPLPSELDRALKNLPYMVG